MNATKSALLKGLTIAASPMSKKGIEVELQNGGYLTPKLFAGFRAILTGGKQRYIGLADNGKTKLPEGAKISGLHLPDGAKVVRVTWDEYPVSCFQFLVTPNQQLIGIEPAAGIDINTAPTSFQVRGFFNLTALVIEGERFVRKLKGKTVPSMARKEFHVLRYPKIEEGLRVMVPGLAFLNATTTTVADDLKEGKSQPPKPSKTMVRTSSHALVKLPEKALGETVTPRGYPEEWLTFAHIPDEENVVFVDTGLPMNGSNPIYAVHHLRTLLAAASA